MELISGFDSVQKRLLRGELRQNMLISEGMTLLAPVKEDQAWKQVNMNL
ncbi:hypothetical protein ACCC92_25035 [Mucilaginibacter sp. Mucisp84]